MRISTNTMYNTGSARMSDLQSSLNKTQLQMTAGKRILSPSDDPVASAQALELKQSQSINEQYATNRSSAKSSLGMEENALQSITLLLQDVKTIAVNAGNGVLDSDQRKYFATELSGRYDELLALANSRDGAGNYIFAGYQTTTQPFTKTPTGASYSGDQGERILQVGPQRQMALSDSGSIVFESNRTGNGTFVSAATGTNAGSGVISPGSVVNSAAFTGKNYTISFTDATTFDIIDNSDPLAPITISPGNAFVSGQAIVFDGVQIDITGAPAAGDSFTVEPSKNESIFTALKDLINLLNQPATDSTTKANLTNGLNAAHASLDSALDSVLTVRSSVGARLKELDSLDAQGEDRDISYATALSNLEDLDYTKAITDFSKQKIMLEAAQQAFVKTTGLSLFNYIS
ncbi:flagellar hook-associated protein FlgL [Noviherbaspirillum sp. Root189]|uniref:flagellar hook-associated protein FlgL n=1 Tax=Noviherbaspirillum sp. Root189 TaxID=1736487 RepID=UPI0007102A82|nr:flagellar hook-associated protein FlgL [Noviherbaspirillum sp. Root189]KRB93332.1 flagellar hook protein [Noviherbaspirillum sp. Root189]